jgi:conjugative transfer signal peptidase TraF
MSRRINIAVGLVWGSAVAIGIAAACGVHINVTASMPEGLWTADAGPIRVGTAAVVCLAPSEQTNRYVPAGSCANGREPLLKTVAAMAGDLVTVSRDGIAVNGQNLLETTPLTMDHLNRPLIAYAPGSYRVQPGQVWLVTPHVAESYDSRYWGPVDAGQIIAIGKPLWVNR